MASNLVYMDDLIGLRFDGFFMAKYAYNLYFSGMKNEIYHSFRISSDWDINFDPADDFTNKTGEAPPNLPKLWTYVEKNLTKFHLAKNELSCSFYFEDKKEPIVIWKDPNQPGELLIVTPEDNSGVNEGWWTIG